MAAVDFHCTDIAERIVRLLGARGVGVGHGPAMSVDDVKNVIWVCSSSVTNKKTPPFSTERTTALPPSEKNTAAWGVVGPLFRTTSRRILQERTAVAQENG
jgi:hypothetical protein